MRMVGLWDGLSHLNNQIQEVTGRHYYWSLLVGTFNPNDLISNICPPPKAGSRIAFTATMLPKAGCLGPFTSNMSISYQSVSLNQGSGYNPALGELCLQI